MIQLDIFPELAKQQILHGDCLDVMRTMQESSIDFIVTDPPYGLHFMGKEWDGRIPAIEIWAEALRVAKPGAMLAAFGGSRTHHHLMCAIEGAGWEIRNVIMWVYGSGFPKSMDISKAVDKANGIAFETRGHFQFTQSDRNATKGAYRTNEERKNPGCLKKEPIHELAKIFFGYGTALKPAYEPIILAMKPLDGTFAQNAEKWGVAGINIDGSRISINDTDDIHKKNPHTTHIDTNSYSGGFDKSEYKVPSGRWPANIIFDEEAAKELDEQSGINASRFFYCAKASPSERGKDNTHPTVKPISLMKYILKLLAPPGNPTCLDPFAGSGSTLVAAKELGINCIGIEKQEEYVEIAKQRVKNG